jgi:hypothetical protein
MSGGGPLASRLVVGLAGPGLDPAERAWLERRQPAGVILFGRNVIDHKQLSHLCAVLRELVPGLEIVADQEGGPVSVLAAAVGRPPAAATLGLLDDPDLTRRVHADLGRRLAACGIDRVLSPVADVLTCRRNPVIGVRAFGSDEDLAARHVAAAVAGLMEGGVAACLKHWPGHGGTAADSHAGDAPLETGQPSGPFAAGLAAGADAVMVAHVMPPGGGLPASLDPAQAQAARALDPGRSLCLYADDITMGALRGPLAARGAVIEGEGMVEPAALTEAWCEAILAGGCDRLLVRGIPWGLGGEGAAGPAPAAAVPAVAAPPDAASWTEARRRLAAFLPAGFAAADRTLCWVDRTAGDRWGPLGRGEGGAQLPAWLAGGFARIAGAEEAGGCDRLLVTSHRPWGRDEDGGWIAGLAAVGQAFIVGHPSLDEDMRGLLPAGWSVAWTPEWPASGAAQKI